MVPLQLDFDTSLDDWTINGTPRECLATIAEARERGLDGIGFTIYSLPREVKARIEYLRMIAHEIVRPASARPLTVLRPFTFIGPRPPRRPARCWSARGGRRGLCRRNRAAAPDEARRLRPRHLVDVKRIPGFGAISSTRARAYDRRAVTHRTVEQSALVRARCPLVGTVARHVANVRVRNVGTVGGNLAFADPHSDLATLFLTFDASVELQSPRGRRELPLDDFVLGPWETARTSNEVVASVKLTPWPGETHAAA